LNKNEQNHDDGNVLVDIVEQNGEIVQASKLKPGDTTMNTTK
jgi:hypothetical protein